MSVLVPTYAEFQNLVDRVSALEAGGTATTGQRIWVERTERWAERHDSIPVTRGDGDIEWRNIMELEVRDIVAGEQWLCFAEYHGTNDDLRGRGRGLTFVHELRTKCVGGNDDRDGYKMNEDQGGQNISPGAHHDYRLVPGYYKWDYSRDSAFIKFLGHAKSTAAEPGDVYKIDRNMGYIYLLRIQ